MITDYLTVDHLASRWNMSTKTLSTWRQKGLGCKFKIISGMVVYKLADIEKYESENWYIRSVKE
jgi:hypothetical protein